MNNLLIAVYLFVAALVLAYLEVQIEGPDGWAAKLPTWRKTSPWVLRLNGGRPLTGYHLALTTFLLLMFHFPFLWTAWSWSAEVWAIACLISFSIVWDCLWFVINPAFGIRKFRKGQIWWFRSWFLGLPIDYYLGLAASFALALIIEKETEWVSTVVVFVGLIIVTILIVSLARRSRPSGRS